LKLPDVVERLEKQGGNEIVGGTPAEFAGQIAEDLKLYSRLIREAGIKAE
jgi:tripartite-type tricarboxylate transporter receptor subunit TctC